MKRLFKILAVLLGILAVLVLAASILLRIYLPPEKAKALVLQHLSDQLKREVDVGSVSVGLLSGLEMSKLRISESPNFSKGTFLSSDLFSLKVSLAPLIFRKVIVRQILLKHPEVTLVRNADGKTFNFSDLTSSTAPTPPAEKAAPGGANEQLPFLLVVSRAQIQNGIVHFVDRSPAQASIEIAPLDLLFKGVSLTDPFSIQTSMHVKSKGKELGVQVAGQANMASGAFKLTTGSFALGPVKATVTGTLSQLNTSDPVCKIHLETNTIPVREALRYAQATLPEGLILDGATKVSADLSGTATNIQFAVRWNGTDLLIAKGDDFAKPTGVPLDVSVTGSRSSPNEILLKSVTATLGANELKGSGAYRTAGPSATVDFIAKGTNWSVQDLAKISPILAPYHPTGSLSFDARAVGPVSAPQTSLATSASIAMTNIKQDYYQGQNLQLNWNLKDVTPDLAHVNGTAALKQGPGKILNMDKLAAGSRVGKIALAPLQILSKIQEKGLLQEVNLPSLQSIPFDSIVGDYLFTAGVMTIKTFNLNGSTLSIENQGTVGLAGAQPIHLNVVMKLAAGSIGGTLGAILNDASGRPTLKFVATGTAANPNVKLDTHEVGKKALEQAGQEILKNDNVQKAIGDALKGLFH